MTNPFCLYDDADGFTRANAEIQRAVDKLIAALEKHSDVGSTDTGSLDAVTMYIWHNVRLT